MIRVPGKISGKNFGRNIRRLTPWKEKKELEELEQERLALEEKKRQEEAEKEPVSVARSVEAVEEPLVDQEPDIQRPDPETIRPVFDTQPDVPLESQRIPDLPAVMSGLEEEPEPTPSNSFNVVKQEGIDLPQLDELRRLGKHDFNRNSILYPAEYEEFAVPDIETRSAPGYEQNEQRNQLPELVSPQRLLKTGLSSFITPPEQLYNAIQREDGSLYTPKEQTLNGFFRMLGMLSSGTQRAAQDAFRTGANPMFFATEEPDAGLENIQELQLAETIYGDFQEVAYKTAGIESIPNPFKGLNNVMFNYTGLRSLQAQLSDLRRREKAIVPINQPERGRWYQRALYIMSTAFHNAKINDDYSIMVADRNLAYALGDYENVAIYDEMLEITKKMFKPEIDVGTGLLKGEAYYKQTANLIGSIAGGVEEAGKHWIATTPFSIAMAVKVSTMAQAIPGLAVTPEEVVTIPGLIAVGNSIGATFGYMKHNFKRSYGESLMAMEAGQKLRYTYNGEEITQKQYKAISTAIMQNTGNWQQGKLKSEELEVYDKRQSLFALGSASVMAGLEFVQMGTVARFAKPMLRGVRGVIDPKNILTMKWLTDTKRLSKICL